MRPEQWEPLPRREDHPPTWLDRHGPALLMTFAFVFLALLDILGL